MKRRTVAVVQYTHNGVPLKFKMTRDGLKVRRKYARGGWQLISLKQLAILSGLCPLYAEQPLPLGHRVAGGVVGWHENTAAQP